MYMHDLKTQLIQLRLKAEFNEAKPVEEELELFKRELELFKKEPEILYEIGLIYFKGKEYEEAIKCFEEILKIQSNNEKAFSKLIESEDSSYRDENRSDEMYDKIIKRIQEKLNGEQTPFNIIKLCLSKLYDLNKFDNARKWFEEKAPPSVKEEPEILDIMGWIYFDDNDYDEAVKCFDKILEIQKHNKDYLIEELGKGTLEKLNKNALEKKIESLRFARRFDKAKMIIEEKEEEMSKLHQISISTKVMLKKQRGWFHFDQKQYKEAIKAFDDGIFNQLPRDADDYINAIEGKIASLRLQRLFKNAEEQLNKLDPDISKRPAIQNERGRLYFDQKLYDKAIDIFRQLLESSNCPAWYRETAYEGIIASLRLQGKFDEAMKKADKALKERLRKNKAGIINQQGWIIFDATQKFLDEVQNKFDEARELASDCLDKAKKKVDEARELASDVTKFLDDETQKKFNKAAESAFNLIQESFGKAQKFDKTAFYEARRIFNEIAAKPAFDKAQKKFDETAKLAKRWPQPRFNEIHVLSRLNLEDKMKETIEKLEKDFPFDLEVKEQIGWVYLLQNKIKKAETEFREILKNNKENTWGINGLGAVYLAQGEYKKAEESFKKILDYKLENPIFLNNLVLTLVRQDEPNLLHDAKAKCDKALEQDADYAPVFLCLAVIAFKQGRYSESEYYLKKSIETGMRGSYTDLGALYAKMGRDDEAEEKLEKAIRTNPNDIQARLELNNLRFQKAKNNKDKKREINKARELFEEAKNIDPNNGIPDKAYALVLMQSGKFNKAEKVLRDALRRLDDSKRWQLHLTLSHLLLSCGEKIDNSKLLQRFCFMLSKLFKKRKTPRTYYQEALKEANKAKILKPTHPDAYFYSGFIQCRLREYKSASEDFEACQKNTLEKNELYFEAKRYVNYIKPFIQSQEDTWSIKKSFIIALLILLMEIGVFALFCYIAKIDYKDLVSLITTVAIALLVAPFLPFLRRLRLPGGVEAEMKPPEVRLPEILVSLGPTGEVGFGSLLPTITSGWLGSRLNWPGPRQI